MGFNPFTKTNVQIRSRSQWLRCDLNNLPVNVGHWYAEPTTSWIIILAKTCVIVKYFNLHFYFDAPVGSFALSVQYRNFSALHRDTVNINNIVANVAPVNVLNKTLTYVHVLS